MIRDVDPKLCLTDPDIFNPGSNNVHKDLGKKKTTVVVLHFSQLYTEYY
jgi:hypothetical protein